MFGIFKKALGSVAILAAATLVSTSVTAKPLVNAAWVQYVEGHENLVLLDVRSQKAFRAGHIAGSVRTSYPGKWRSLEEGRGTVMPTATEFARLADSLGITPRSHVAIIAETRAPGGAATAAEVYFTLRYFGHRYVSIVDGGIAALKANSNLTFETGPSVPTPTTGYYTNRKNLLQADLEQVFTAVGHAQMLDARITEQYLGLRKASYVERAGSIPGSRNLPYKWLLSDDGTFLDDTAIASLLTTIGLDKNRRMIVFGNSSREAALVWFAAYELARFRKTQLYVGAMAEWAAKDFTPMVRPTELSSADEKKPALRLSGLTRNAAPAS